MEALSDPPCFLIKASNAFSSGYFSLPMKTTVKKAIMIIVNKQNCRTYYLLKLSRYLRTNIGLIQELKRNKPTEGKKLKE